MGLCRPFMSLCWVRARYARYVVAKPMKGSVGRARARARIANSRAMPSWLTALPVVQAARTETCSTMNGKASAGLGRLNAIAEIR